MRTPVTLKIKFKSASLDQFIERYSVDVSRGGIFIRTKEPLAIGTQLKFEFQLQDASSLIAGEGTVVWIREHDPARTGVAPGMGVRFDRLAPASQQVLGKILAEKQKRGEAAQESRFDAGVRASASASGTVNSTSSSTASSSTPTPVATPVVTEAAASARLAGHNDFSGGDSKHETPLPPAAPGLDDPAEEFAEESTRVMQDAVVQALASRTREEPAKPAPRDDGFSDNEPTRHSIPDPEAIRQSKQSRNEEAPTPPPSGSNGASNGAAAKPAPPPPSRPLSAPEPFGGPTSMGAISPAAERVSTPPRKSGSSSALIAIVGIVVVGAAIGAYVVWGRGSAPAPNNPTPLTTTAPAPAQPTQPTQPSQATTAANNPPANPTPPTANPPVNNNPPAAAKVERWVDVSSTPPGAEVAVDGKPVGKTPYKLRLTDATTEHIVELKRAGFVTQTRNVTPADAFLSKNGKEVLALAVALEAEPKPGKAPPHRARDPHAKGPPTGKLPAPPPVTGDKPAATPDSTGDKPAEAKPDDKPADTAAPKDDSDKGAKAEKADKTDGEKADKGDKAADTGDSKIKTPGWASKPDKPADDKPADDKTQ